MCTQTHQLGFNEKKTHGFNNPFNKQKENRAKGDFDFTTNPETAILSCPDLFAYNDLGER